MENKSFDTVLEFLEKCEREEKGFYVSFCIGKIGISTFYFNKNEYEIFSTYNNGDLISILKDNDYIDIHFDDTTKTEYYDYLLKDGYHVLKVSVDNSNNYILIGEIV